MLKKCSLFLTFRKIQATFEYSEKSSIYPWILITVNNNDGVASDEGVEKRNMRHCWKEWCRHYGKQDGGRKIKKKINHYKIKQD